MSNQVYRNDYEKYPTLVRAEGSYTKQFNVVLSGPEYVIEGFTADDASLNSYIEYDPDTGRFSVLRAGRYVVRVICTVQRPAYSGFDTLQTREYWVRVSGNSSSDITSKIVKQEVGASILSEQAQSEQVELETDLPLGAYFEIMYLTNVTDTILGIQSSAYTTKVVVTASEIV